MMRRMVQLVVPSGRYGVVVVRASDAGVVVVVTSVGLEVAHGLRNM